VNAATTILPNCPIASTIKIGSTGSSVICLQTFLGLPADGSFGPKTKAAVMAWQLRSGLVADGVFGPKSIAMIMKSDTTAKKNVATTILPLPPIIHSTGKTYFYDVVIVGAGTGGTAAAIQAARMGMRVALLEETDWVGGQATAAAVSGMDTGGLSSSGIYKEFIDRINSYYTAHGKTQSDCYTGYHVCFEPSVGQTILKQMMSEAALSVNMDVTRHLIYLLKHRSLELLSREYSNWSFHKKWRCI